MARKQVNSGSGAGAVRGQVRTQGVTDGAGAAAALSVKDLSVAYRRNLVLSDVHLTVPAGSVTAIIGPNGAGKSTLIKSIIEVVPRLSGEILVFGEPYKLHRALTAYVPQRNSVDWDYPVNALDVVAMGLYRQVGMLRAMRPKDYRRAKEALDRVGMLGYARTHISDLSGGQQQRLFIARALVQDAKLIFMDEPFAGVDARTEQSIIDLIHNLRERGQTAVIVHHDLRTVKKYFDRVVLLNNTVIASGETGETFTTDAINRCYGGAVVITDAGSGAGGGGGGGKRGGV